LHDAVIFEGLGVPAMLLITEPFIPIVAAFGSTVGVEDYPAVAVPHPVSSLDDDGLRKLASTVIDEAEARLIPPT
jgi:hypothetical protein